MFRNHLQTAWRGLIKNPLYSAINIGGLGLALCACMLILLYVLHEYSFDRFEARGNRLFAVYAQQKGGTPYEGTSYAAGIILAENAPEVESITRLDLRPELMTLSDKSDPKRAFNPRKPIFADGNFFTRFSFPLLSGDPALALARPWSIVLGKSLATTLFGKENPIGKVLVYNKKYDFEVTGVAAELPSNAYLDFDAVCSLSSFAHMDDYQWLTRDNEFLTGNLKTYVLLKDPRDVPRVERVMEKVKTSQKGPAVAYSLSPVRQDHMRGYMGRAANRPYLKIFSLVALLILLLALMNYMSLATARAAVRAREVGVRKTLGAGRGTLIAQFYVESALCTALAFLLGLVLYLSARSAFLALLHVEIDPGFGYSPAALAAFAALLLGTILISGGYPSVFLSSLKPAETPKGTRVRKVLTVMQFTIATGLIISLSVMKQQLYFFVHKDIGLNRDNIVMIPYDEELEKHEAPFRADIASLHGVQQTATTLYRLFGGGYSIPLDGGAFKGKKMSLRLINGDTSLFPLLQIHWKFPPTGGSHATRYPPIVLNESAVRYLGLPADPRGMGLCWFEDTPSVTIAGVVRDFSYESLARDIQPVGIIGMNTLRFAGGACLLVKVDKRTYLPSLLEDMKKVYDRYPSIHPFSYSFADDAFNKLYQSEDRMAGLLGIFTGLATIVACLGLFGLATFSTLARTKEIGIRKVLGAEVLDLTTLLTRDFLRLVLLAVVLAWPVSWWVMHDWLQQYAYRIDVSPWILAGAGLGIALLSLLTVGSLALRAARANPVDSLRRQ